MVGSEILKSYLPEFPKEYQYIFSTIKNAKLDPKRLVLSTALEVSNSLAVGAQLALAAGINHFAKDLPKPVLPIIAAGLLTLAYSTGPRKQKEALETRGATNDVAATLVFEYTNNPWLSIIIGTIRQWSIGYVSNGANLMTNALALANSENSLFWANLISQVAIGWGLTMIFNTAIINGDTEKYASYLQKLHLMKPKLIDPIVIN